MASMDWDGFDEVKENGEKNGLKNKLERWRDVEVNIAITGQSGTGKSAFINSIRGIYEDDDNAAAVGVAVTTTKPTAYDHPTNPKIKLWDLPGTGTPEYPDLETYYEEVQLERYHAFLIFTTSRLTENDFKLAKKIRSIHKKFFFVRTKIDENVRAEKRRRSFIDENTILEKIRRNFAENLEDLLSNEQDIFLISNHDPDKWDFARLTKAILDALPAIQRENLTLVPTSFTTAETAASCKLV